MLLVMAHLVQCGSSRRSSPSRAVLVPERLTLQVRLSDVESFGPSAFRPTFDAAQSHQARERLGPEPLLRALAAEVREQVLDLALGDGRRERSVEIGTAEVALVLGDLVLEDE